MTNITVSISNMYLVLCCVLLY